MKRRIKYTVGIVVAALALTIPFALQAEGMTLEELTEKVMDLIAVQERTDSRIAAIETRISVPPTLPPTSTLTPTLTPSSTPVPAASLVVSRNMNVRKGPGTNYKVMGIASKGAEFPITGQNRDGSWWQIDYKGEKGWLYAPYVTAANAGGVEVIIISTPKPTATPTATTTPVPAVTVPRYELEDIFDEYSANDARADAKYLDKVIEVNGVILDIEKIGGGFFSGKEKYEITLEGKGFLTYLDCSLPLSSEEEVLQLNAGESVTLRGELYFGSSTIIGMRDCEIIKE